MEPAISAIAVFARTSRVFLIVVVMPKAFPAHERQEREGQKNREGATEIHPARVLPFLPLAQIYKTAMLSLQNHLRAEGTILT